MAFSRLHILHMAIAIQELVARHYEPGRQDRNYKYVWRKHVRPLYHVGYNTFLKYKNMDAARELRELEELKERERLASKNSLG